MFVLSSERGYYVGRGLTGLTAAGHWSPDVRKALLYADADLAGWAVAYFQAQGIKCEAMPYAS